MRNLYVAAAAAAGLGLAATPAAAQADAPFTGARAEALVGLDVVVPDDGVEQFTGLLYGGAIGYDYQTGDLVLGAEAELSGSGAKAEDEYDGISAEARAGRDIYGGVRVGYAVPSEAMLYVKAGYTNARFEAEYDDGEISEEGHADVDGFRVGFGLEYKLGPVVHLKSEYRYSNYGTSDDLDIKLERHQLMAGVGIRF
jgi:outer membrane immunogenic protein